MLKKIAFIVTALLGTSAVMAMQNQHQNNETRCSLVSKGVLKTALGTTISFGLTVPVIGAALGPCFFCTSAPVTMAIEVGGILGGTAMLCFGTKLMGTGWNDIQKAVHTKAHRE